MIKTEGWAAGSSNDLPADWPEPFSSCPDVRPPIQSQGMRILAQPQIHRCVT